MKRHLITLGARTTANGVVTSASSRITIDGARVALEGDEVSCHACGSTGLIRCTGPRTPERFNGRLVALENDECVCNCATPPRLLPSQHLRYQNVDDSSR
ncbi:PAAR domain-containing protein [Massilia norwichensis]|uniref:PAAR domain-containing protein n=1 Tax=Massilia norwichensis TaxID=1442366 RepID=A0ABT2A9L7_9BURK|nr:PAAR domain-containing protein [Massilia norwichensis]MCS0590490.1 PAAR domain-containing protein [Massilia norwichensis]